MIPSHKRIFLISRVAEKRYAGLGGKMTVILREGEGHTSIAPENPEPILEFITRTIN